MVGNFNSKEKRTLKHNQALKLTSILGEINNGDRRKLGILMVKRPITKNEVVMRPRVELQKRDNLQ